MGSKIKIMISLIKKLQGKTQNRIICLFTEKNEGYKNIRKEISSC
jgi:hypothetical protein